MENEISEFLGKYNNYMKDFNEYNYIYSPKEVYRKVCIKCESDTNLYDELAQLYPTIRKYIMLNYHKIYYDGKQKLIRKNEKCHLCNMSFIHICSAALDYENDNKIIHAKCLVDRITLRKFNTVNEFFRANNICKICNKPCLDNNNVIMNEDIFYHKQCCQDRIRNKFKDEICYICKELLFPNIYLEKLEYCHEAKDILNCIHLLCTKDKSKKYKKSFAHTNFNKCGICKFYIIDEQYIHKICLNNT